MTNDTMSVDVEQEEMQAKRPRGRPRKNNDENMDVGVIADTPIKKADVVTDYTVIDPWLVRNKRDGFEYRWARMNDDMEMMEFAAKSYVPACGNEIIVGNPFEASKTGPGERKIRGNRILMCCPKDFVDARREKQARKSQKASDSANRDARNLSARTNLGVLDISDTQKTVRESIEEPVIRSEE